MLQKIIILGLLLSIPLFAWDNEFDAEGNYQVSVKDTVKGDYFFAGADLTFDGYAESDVFSFSRSIEMNGKTGDDLFAMCQNVNIKGEVMGNVFAGGETVKISGIVHGDLNVFGGTVSILDGAVIHGNVSSGTGYFTFAETAEIKGGLYVGAGRADLEGKVGKGTKLELGEVGFASSFSSGDSVRLTLTKETDAPVANAPHNLVVKYKTPDRFYTCGFFYWMMISAIIIALIILALFPEIPQRLTDIAVPEVLQNFGLGALIMFLTPFVIILSIAILPAAFILLTLYAILLYLGTIFSGIAIGEVLLKDNLNVYLRTALSLFVIYFLVEIPILGALLSFLLILFGMGVFINYIWKLRKGKWSAV